MIHLLKNLEPIVSLIAAGAAGVAAYFAYKSARMSEIANKAQFSPLLIPTQIYYQPDETTQPSHFFVRLDNTTEYKNAYAKNISASLNGDTVMRDDIGPGSYHHFKWDNIEKPSSGKIRFFYEDVLGNKFETTCHLMGESSDNENKILFAWRYIQK